MTFGKTFLVVSFALCLTGAAVAQDRGTESDQEACTPDVFRLCQDLIPDEGRITQCLQSRPTQLSPACYKVFFPTPPARVTPIPVDATAKKPMRHHYRVRHHKAVQHSADR